ncbi:MAG: hypothetical protein Q8903_15575 [Bacteroidota bacterium]|nr:hypothetical protein [Bacteroidota bacterium]
MDFCKCGSIKINGKCSNAHCSEKNQKRKDWVVGGMAMDFKKPVSYEEASQLAERLKSTENNL